jgi:crotonobetainyl-CoA:carnitine CoA-transferase CaiB-like acyl-CoA transferase
MLLGDLGADVVKVEPPQGEHSRDWGAWERDKKSFLFYALNRNKRSVVLDLKSELGRQHVRELASGADVLVESLAPGGADKLGLAYDDLAAVNPALVYCSVSGFGRTGPLSGELGLDQMLQAFTGIMNTTGEADRPPVRIAVSAIDMLTGALAFGGVLSALLEREESGRGQRVEATLYDSALSMLSWAIPQVAVTGEVPRRTGSEFEHVAPYGVFRAKDDLVYIGAATPAHWRRLCDELVLPELRDDERFATPSRRVQNKAELVRALEGVFMGLEADHLVTRLKVAGVPSSRIRTVADVIEDEHAWTRGSLRRLSGDPDVVVAATPFRLDRGMREVWLDPPMLGSASAEVLGHLGWEEPATSHES